jgi:RNA polymerase sigma factor (sigma-70 family)
VHGVVVVRGANRWSVRSTPLGLEITSTGFTGRPGRSADPARKRRTSFRRRTRVLARPRLLRHEDDLGYLLRALRNTFLNQKRTERRRLRPAPLPDELDVVADPRAVEPQAAVEAGELYAAIAALPDDFRDVLVAVDVTGLSYRETARALRIREGTVMSRLYRARQQVVRRFEGTVGS